MQHRLPEPERQGVELDVHADGAALLTDAEQLGRGRGHLERGALRHAEHVLTRCGWGLVEREQHGRSVATRAGGQLTSERDDLVVDRRLGFTGESSQCLISEPIEVDPVLLDQLDEDGLLRFEVVVEAARQDPTGIGDLLERGAHPG